MKFRELKGFRDLQNYTTLKLNMVVLGVLIRFRDLQNYTTLKPIAPSKLIPLSFRDLQNYTTCKCQYKNVQF